jgi:hypothetical protein
MACADPSTISSTVDVAARFIWSARERSPRGMEADAVRAFCASSNATWYTSNRCWGNDGRLPIHIVIVHSHCQRTALDFRRRHRSPLPRLPLPVAPEGLPAPGYRHRFPNIGTGQTGKRCAGKVDGERDTETETGSSSSPGSSRVSTSEEGSYSAWQILV